MSSLLFERLSNVESEAVDWIWAGRLARGKTTLLSGDPGIGKSQISADVAARISTAALWPDGGRAPLGSVLMLSAEDGIEDTLRPRLEAAAADLNYIYALRSVMADNVRRTFSLQADLALLSEKIGEIGDVAVVIIDPITSYMGKLDSHRTTDVRSVLEPVADFAAANKVAVLAISHPPKAATEKAINAVTGSLAFVAAARMVFVAVDDPNGERRLLLPIKNNLAPLPGGIGYRLAQRVVTNGITVSHIEWDAAPVTMTANEVLCAKSKPEDRSAKADAIEFLQEVLASGGLPVRRVLELAKDAGIEHSDARKPGKPLRSAREALGIKPQKLGVSEGWGWSLPDRKAIGTS